MDESESFEEIEEKISIDESIEQLLFSNNDEILHEIEKTIGLFIAARGQNLTIYGHREKVEIAKRVISNLTSNFKSGKIPTRNDISIIVRNVKEDLGFNVNKLKELKIKIGPHGKTISPKSIGQAKYFEAISKNDLIFVIGPAGTGKTYIAMAFALNYLTSENISRIILTRPVVEAGESLGYLPGDLEQKVDPYLRPLYDAIYDMIPYNMFQRYVERGAIEVAPLAYMRGRTLHDSFIILDEAQNTTRGQMLMFLTRIGFNSKTIITGDITQVDIPRTQDSGLVVASKVLKGIEGIAFIYMGPEDVVRHPLVERIIKAFQREEEKRRDDKDKNK
ncbi:MAG: phosphate starvation-inducible protein PhoH [Spirochaetes bacterium]|nr:MAG: phosphate starvation-inducible protein PhoH [Spirochaetota bacterium]RKY00836.1 MAG: phosphate starvation-inducible protein PhoH [Spirochaetota bacterium]